MQVFRLIREKIASGRRRLVRGAVLAAVGNVVVSAVLSSAFAQGNGGIVPTDPTVDVVNFALASQGATISGGSAPFGDFPVSALIDGVGSSYSRYLTLNIPAQQSHNLDLGQERRISGIELHLYDGDIYTTDAIDRFFRYKVESSLDGVAWSMLVDRTTGEHRGLQRLSFDEVNVRYLRITGTFTSLGSSFHLISELKVLGRVPALPEVEQEIVVDGVTDSGASFAVGTQTELNAGIYRVRYISGALSTFPADTGNSGRSWESRVQISVPQSNKSYSFGFVHDKISRFATAAQASLSMAGEELWLWIPERSPVYFWGLDAGSSSDNRGSVTLNVRQVSGPNDSLIVRVRDSMTRSILWQQQEVAAWDNWIVRSDRSCFGCHIQTQATKGLSESKAKLSLLPVSSALESEFVDAYARWQLPGGFVSPWNNHYTTQTSLWAWAVSAMRGESFATLTPNFLNALNFIISRQDASSGGWNADHDSSSLYNDGVPSATHTSGNLLALARAVDEFEDGQFVPFTDLTISGGSVALARRLGQRLDVRFAELSNVTGVRISIADSFNGDGNFVLNEVEAYDGNQPLSFANAVANFSQNLFPVARLINGVRNNQNDGWAYSPRDVRTQAAQAVLLFGAPTTVSRLRLTSVYSGAEVKAFTISYTTDVNPTLGSIFVEAPLDVVGSVVTEAGGTIDQYLTSLRNGARALSSAGFQLARNNRTAAQTIIGLTAALPYLDPIPAAEARSRIAAAAAHLRSVQRADGGWCDAASTNCPSRAHASAQVLKALLSTETVLDSVTTAGAEHLLLTQDADGAWTSRPLARRLAATTSVEIALPALFETLEGQYTRSTVDDLVAIGGLHSVELNWSPIPGATGYNIYRRTGSGPAERVATSHVTEVATYTDLNLPNDITFFYTVKWLAADGLESSESNEASGTPYGLECGSDTPPIIQSRAVSGAIEGAPYVYRVDAFDPDVGDVLNFSLSAAPNGMSVESSTGEISWTPTARDVGSHFVRVVVTDRIGRFASQAFRVTVGRVFFNRAPVFRSTPPNQAVVGYRYRYAARAEDPNLGDVLTYSLLQNPQGMNVNASTGLVQWTPIAELSGAAVPVELAATDLGGLSATQPFTVSVTANTPPQITSVAPARAPRQALYLYQATAVDAEGGALTWRLVGAPQGMTVGVGTGRVLWTPRADQVGSYSFSVQVFDPAGASAVEPITLLVPENDAPAFGSIPAPTAYVGFEYRYQVRVSDPEGFPVVVSLDAGAPTGAAFSNSNLFTFTPSAGQLGPQAVTVRAVDNVGNVALQSWTINVVTGSPPGGGGPGGGGPGGSVTLDILSPARGSEIRARTPVRGSIVDQRTDQTVPLTWTLSLQRGEGGERIPLGSGVGAFVDGEMGTIDPTLLQTDTYSLVVQASGGGFSTEQAFFPYDVSSRVQLGDFSTSVVDLNYPMAGVPLSVARAYNSTDLGRYDFGIGWRLRLPGRVTDTAREGAGGWDSEAYNGGTRVFVTLPDGRREGFTFAPYQISPFFPGLVPAFRPDPGVTSTLETGVTFLVRSGAEIWELFGPYNPSRFTLTTRDRVKYTIDEQDGLVQMEDANRNRITFARTAFTHSGGEALQIARDSAGRITEISDPGARRHRYVYTAAGELESYADPLGQITRYSYDPQHRLLTITDPAGVVVLRNEYNAAGRLVRQFDALGNAIAIAVDPGANTQAVTDRRGFTTTYRFDANGNLAQMTDALGGIKSFEYDANFNVVRETDALGRVTRSEFDARSNLVRELDAAGGQRLLSFNSQSQITALTNPLGQTTNFSYSNTGNLTRVTDPSGRQNQLAYDSTGGMTGFIDALNNRISIDYDAAGRPNRLVDALGKAVAITYNADGKPVSTSRVKTNPDTGAQSTVLTQYEYDALGRPTRVTDAEGRVATTVWNRWNKPERFTDRRGSVFNFEYDAQGQLTRIQYPDSTETVYVYDSEGNKLTETDRTGRITAWEYDALGRVTATVYPGGARSTTEYDAVGNPVREINAIGGITQYFYDARNLKTREIDPVGRETLYQRDGLGREVSVTLPTGARRDHEYDVAGRLIRTVETDGTIFRWEYDAAGRLVREINSRGGFRSLQYDANGRVVVEVDETGATKSYQYDELGNSVRVADETGAVTRREFDRVGRLTRAVSPLNEATQFSYDANDNVTSERDPLNREKRMEYDLLDRVSREVNALNQAVVHSYDGEGRKLSVTDAAGRISRMRYDVRGNVSEAEDQLAGITRYFYDGLQNKIRTVDRTGREQRTSYDSIGRPIQEQWVASGGAIERTVTKSYAVNGQVASESDGVVTYQYGYDNRERLSTVAVSGIGGAAPFTISYQYDSDGNVTAISDSTGASVGREVDARGAPVSFVWQATGGTGSRVEITRDPRGLETQVRRFADSAGDTLVARTNKTFDADARIDLIAHQRANATGLSSFDYEYDLGSQVIREQTLTGSAQYVYDLIGQVLGVDNSSGSDESFTYDVNGNRLGDGRQYDTANRLVRDNTFDYSYDAEGNLILKRNRTTNVVDEFIYDYRQQLTRVTRRQGATVQGEVVYQYDARGRRVMRSVNGVPLFTVFNGDQPWADLDLNGQVVARYLYGDGIDQLLAASKAGEGLSFYLTDRLGSVRQRIDAGGSVLGATDYNAFGSSRNPTGSVDRFGFTARELDLFSGLYYYRARQYDPINGRFTGQDPLKFAAGDTNFYRYAFNAPTMYTDPTGMFVLGEYRSTLTPAATLASSQNTALVGAQLQVLEAASAVRNLGQAVAAAARKPALEVIVADTRFGLEFAKVLGTRLLVVAGVLGIRGDDTQVTETIEEDGTILETAVTQVEKDLTVTERRRRRDCDPKDPQPRRLSQQQRKHAAATGGNCVSASCFYEPNSGAALCLDAWARGGPSTVTAVGVQRKYCYSTAVGYQNSRDGRRLYFCVDVRVRRDCSYHCFPRSGGRGQ